MRWNALLGACLLGSALVFAALVWIVWQNRGGERVQLLFLKAVFGPLVVTLFLVLYDFAKPLDIIDESTPLTFYRVGTEFVANRRLLADETLPEMPSGYVKLEVAYGQWLKSHGQQVSRDQLEQMYLDIVEAGFVHWLTGRYTTNWRIKQRMYDSLHGSLGRVSGPAEDAERRPLKLTTERLGEILRNDVITSLRMGPVWTVALPSGSKLRYEPKTEEGGRSLVVETPYTRFAIDFKLVAGGQLKDYSGKLPERINKVLGGVNAEFWVVYVTFKAAPKRIRRWSGRTAEELEWAKGMADSFNQDFRWQAPASG